MGLSYEDFKRMMTNRDSIYYGQHKTLIRDIDEFYKDKMLFFYPKNLFNDKVNQLIFFFDNGYLIVTKDRGQYTYEQFYCRVIKKMLKTTRHIDGNHELKVVYDNNDELIFNNLEDSNFDWVEEYSEMIRTLFKTL